jgi:hypothetical protein
MAEDQRCECRPGHADRVGEGQQPADVVQGVPQPPLGQRHDRLRPPLDQVAQLQLREPRRSPEDRYNRRDIDPGQRIGRESHSHVGTIPAESRDARAPTAHTESELYRDSTVTRQATQTRLPARC